jgi:hypothetical protein
MKIILKFLFLFFDYFFTDESSNNLQKLFTEIESHSCNEKCLKLCINDSNDRISFVRFDAL